MMGRRKIIATAMLLASAVAAHAQWDVQFSDFTTLRSFYNPAISGTDGLLNVAAAYSIQMSGYEHAPVTMYAGADIPIYILSPRHGAGLSFMNDQIGIFKTQRMALQYAYNTKLGEKGRLAIGAQAAMMNETIDPSDMILNDQNDPAFPSSSTEGESVDFGAGIYYYHPRLWLALSSIHLTAPTLNMGEKYEISISRMYYFMAGGNIKLKNTLLSLHPAVMVQTDMQSWREDIQCKLAYEYEGRKFYAGVGYSPNISVTAMIGGNFHGIQLGYSYQMYTAGVGIQNGAHELVFRYQTDLDLFRKGKNLHKSARFL
ncbi:MAG: type IX secretion system membrane protein PorP/SprF [Bacteroidaceae bacterium]|nr:type IX secretion system membrane protein PorP/SprF [Bacteroidaceae bacterium]MBQ9176118.1 type IX secretion system membrane protein PorP/SprF [Bacteroidaceae bacterium]MBR1379239.1 type IX secretion system membrane protein PorP/SprF [Bacteroidaceae bacterium]